MADIEFNNCDLEPIHIPGKIQSHGFLFILNEEYQITYLSENVKDLLKITAEELLNKNITEVVNLFGTGTSTDIIKIIVESAAQGNGFDLQNSFAMNISGEPWLMIVHKCTDSYLLDFEPEKADMEGTLQQYLGRSLSRILSSKKMGDILLNAAVQVRKIIQYDRVMVYKFHEDGHGEVVAESKEETLNSWLGLHYPASDIPKQARELYKLNLTRLISNVNLPSSSLITRESGPVDLTDSTLRAVSPVHIQYLKNMGVASSFSISIICEGELWGLIACHNYTPRFINYRQREAAKLLGQVLSPAIELRQQELGQQASQHHQKALDALTRYLSRDIGVPAALFEQKMTILDTIPSSGAAMLFEGNLFKAGNVPDEKFLKSFMTWLAEHMKGEVYSNNSLMNVVEDAGRFTDVASGVLVCRLDKQLNEFIIWFRPEIMTVVNWAGRSEKHIATDESGVQFISPRTSFEAWSQQVMYTAEYWKREEIEFALKIKDEINYSISRKATELRALNERLKETYAELDTFAHTIAHDLKNPLTAIKGYAQILCINETSASGEHKIGKFIEQSAIRMTSMIEEVLEYSKVGRFNMIAKEIDMPQLLADIVTEVAHGAENPLLTIDISGTPNIHGDPTMVSQIFSNLISNAVKYSAVAAQPRIVIDGHSFHDHVVYAIKDNGIGIREEDHESIFELFSRSSNALSFSGSGVGLSIVKRMVEKHQGEIRVESVLGEGSCFYVKFFNWDNDPEPGNK